MGLTQGYGIALSPPALVKNENMNQVQQVTVSCHPLRNLNPGDFVGEMGLFEEETQVRSAMVVAKTQCEVAEISYERFHQIRGQFPDILYAISRQIANRLRQTTRKLTDLAFVDVSGRIAHTLLDLCKEPDAMTHPDGMQIKITRQELGKIVGCSREMAGRVLKTLEQDGPDERSGQEPAGHHTGIGQA